MSSINFIEPKENFRPKCFYLGSTTEKSLKRLKTLTNSRSWDNLFKKLVFIAERKLK